MVSRCDPVTWSEKPVVRNEPFGNDVVREAGTHYTNYLYQSWKWLTAFHLKFFTLAFSFLAFTFILVFYLFYCNSQAAGKYSTFGRRGSRIGESPVGFHSERQRDNKLSHGGPYMWNLKKNLRSCRLIHLEYTKMAFLQMWWQLNS